MILYSYDDGNEVFNDTDYHADDNIVDADDEGGHDGADGGDDDDDNDTSADATNVFISIHTHTYAYTHT